MSGPTKPTGSVFPTVEEQDSNRAVRIMAKIDELTAVALRLRVDTWNFLGDAEVDRAACALADCLADYRAHARRDMYAPVKP